MRTRTLAAVALALAMAAPLSASPRYRRRPPPGGYGPVDREGFLIGFSVGAGGVWPDPCEDCGVAPGAEVHLGAMASPYGDVAVMLEAGGFARDDIHHGFLVAAAQWWPDPFERFWLRGGVGIGSQESDKDPTDHKDAAYATVLAAGGVEVIRSYRFTTDLQAQVAATKEPHHWGRSFGISVGFNWY